MIRVPLRDALEVTIRVSSRRNNNQNDPLIPCITGLFDYRASRIGQSANQRVGRFILT